MGSNEVPRAQGGNTGVTILKNSTTEDYVSGPDSNDRQKTQNCFQKSLRLSVETLTKF